ncbi:MAG: hypothetical protein ACE5EM_11015 [Sphingomonadales bacterium]
MTIASNQKGGKHYVSEVFIRRLTGCICYCNPAATIAADVYQIPGAQYNAFDNYGGTTQINPGAYISIPFSGGFRRSVSKSRFGLTLGATLPGHDRYANRHAMTGAPTLIDLSIGLTGKENFRFNGLTIAGMQALHAAEDGNGKKKEKEDMALGRRRGGRDRGCGIDRSGGSGGRYRRGNS